ncbi:DUF6421 family protein, partial [Clavibacter michiganensis]
MSSAAPTAAVIGEPEVVEDVATVASSPAWLALKDAAVELQPMQVKDGSIPDAAHHAEAARLIQTIRDAVRTLAPLFPHDATYLAALDVDFARWVDAG